MHAMVSQKHEAHGLDERERIVTGMDHSLFTTHDLLSATQY